MTVESAADRLSMLADFGQLVTFSPGDSFPSRNDKTATITGIFDNEYYQATGEDIGSNSRIPTLMVRTADVANAQRNSMVELSTGATYKVIRPEDDGTGITVLILEGPK